MVLNCGTSTSSSSPAPAASYQRQLIQLLNQCQISFPSLDVCCSEQRMAHWSSCARVVLLHRAFAPTVWVEALVRKAIVSVMPFGRTPTGSIRGIRLLFAASFALRLRMQAQVVVALPLFAV